MEDREADELEANFGLQLSGIIRWRLALDPQSRYRFQLLKAARPPYSRDTELRLRRMPLARPAPNIPQNHFRRLFVRFGLLSHLHSFNGHDEPKILLHSM